MKYSTATMTSMISAPFFINKTSLVYLNKTNMIKLRLAGKLGKAENREKEWHCYSYSDLASNLLA